MITHTFKNLDCDLCKKTIPERIKIKNDTYNLFELQRPENNYMILESIPKEKNENKLLYIIHMKNKSKGGQPLNTKGERAQRPAAGAGMVKEPPDGMLRVKVLGSGRRKLLKFRGLQTLNPNPCAR